MLATPWRCLTHTAALIVSATAVSSGFIYQVVRASHFSDINLALVMPPSHWTSEPAQITLKPDTRMYSLVEGSLNLWLMEYTLITGDDRGLTEKGYEALVLAVCFFALPPAKT